MRVHTLFYMYMTHYNHCKDKLTCYHIVLLNQTGPVAQDLKLFWMHVLIKQTITYPL